MGFNKIAIWVLLIAIPFLSAKPRYERGDSSSSDDDDRRIREFFLLIDRVLWDYIPYGNRVDNDTTFIDDMLTPGPTRVGNKWYKYRYNRYTDSTYSVKIPNPAHHGFNGPLLHGEVNDIFHVHLRNLWHVPFSAHPHGVFYNKAHEGALYNDGTSGFMRDDDQVMPNTTRCLIWEITKDFEPLDDDSNCLLFAYHSHTYTKPDVNTGRHGGLVICKKGILNEHGERMDVDKEVTIYVDTLDECGAWLTDMNLNNFQDPNQCWALLNSGDPDFAESCLKDQMNGFMFGSMPDLTICMGAIVQWYIYSLEAEIHPFHINGHTLNQEHRRVSTIAILSATFKTATTVSTHPGVWLVSCLNSEHNSIPSVKHPPLMAATRGKAPAPYMYSPQGVRFGDIPL